MNRYIISGIQQAGIGVPDVKKGFSWYNRMLGMDVPVFEEAAEAKLMLPYTGGKPHSRHAILAINLRGGGGFEIWQYTSRQPQPPAFTPVAGDLGLFCAKIKTDNVRRTYDHLRTNGAKILGEITANPAGKQHFFFEDFFGNHFEIIEDDNWFGPGNYSTGGPNGMIIGVSDIHRSKKFYGAVLGYDKVVYEGEGRFADLSSLPGGDKSFRRVILTHGEPRKGPFSELLGTSYIELLQADAFEPKKIFINRLWGDLGFIHLCFDIRNMKALQQKCEQEGHPFTVDGGSGFEMGEAAGHFTYIEDPDGALIEFVETKKIPILKKLGLYLNLSKRDPEKPLPKFIIRALKFNRKKP